jgi:flavin reductase (DIM6/NTAB) family NADH-FMN oxidoreductase RutF
MNKQDVSHWLPCPVVFVVTMHGDRRDIMTATAMFVSETSPVLAVSVGRGHLTDELLEASGKFMVAIASEDQKELVWQVGGTQGTDGDKFERFSIQTVDGRPGDPPVPAGSAAWMMCRMESAQDVDGGRLVIGRVEEAADLETPPLVWQKNSLFRLASV